MYLDELKDNIRDNYNLGPNLVFESVKGWLQSRGFKEDDFSDPVFIDKQKLEILNRSSMINPEDSIDQEELFELRANSAILDALYAAGVDNWEGFDAAMRALND